MNLGVKLKGSRVRIVATITMVRNSFNRMNKIYYNCGKKHHFICECTQFEKEQKVDNNNDMENTNMVESEVRGIVTVVSYGD